MTYYTGLSIMDCFPEFPENDRWRQIELLQAAGYRHTLNKKPYQQIADRQIHAVSWRVYQEAKQRAAEHEIDLAARNYFAFLCSALNLDPETSPFDPSELEELLFK